MSEQATEPPEEPKTYLLWVNEERTVMSRLWPSGIMEVSSRDDPGDTWGPPAQLKPGQRV